MNVRLLFLAVLIVGLALGAATAGAPAAESGAGLEVQPEQGIILLAPGDPPRACGVYVRGYDSASGEAVTVTIPAGPKGALFTTPQVVAAQSVKSGTPAMMKGADPKGHYFPIAWSAEAQAKEGTVVLVPVYVVQGSGAPARCSVTVRVVAKAYAGGVPVSDEALDLGAGLAFIGEELTVLDVSAKSTAEWAGLKAGDRISRIEKKPTKGMTKEQVEALFNGKAGTLVELEFVTPANREHPSFTMPVFRR